MALHDWRPVKGSKGARYHNKKTGATISKRQYQNQQARAKGFKNYSQYVRLGTAQTLEAKQYRDILREVAETTGVPYKEVRKLSSEFHEIRASAVRQLSLSRSYMRRKGFFLGTRRNKWGYKRDRWSADSDLAKYLVYIGRRDASWTWPVGDTDLYVQ